MPARYWFVITFAGSLQSKLAAPIDAISSNIEYFLVYIGEKLI